MVKFKVFVSDKKESIEHHIEKDFKEAYQIHENITMIAPGAEKVSPEKILGVRAPVFTRPTAQKHALKDFTYDNLMRQYEDQRVLFIENAHLLSMKSIDDLIKFSRQNRSDVYLYSKIHDSNNGVYPILSMLADYGYEPEQLEDFAVQPEPALKKASALPKKKIDHNKAMHVTMANYLKLGPGYLQNTLDENMNAWLKNYDATVALFNRMLPRGLSKNSQLFRTAHALLYYRDWILLGTDESGTTAEQGRTLSTIINKKSDMLDMIISYCLEKVRIPDPAFITFAKSFIRNVEAAEKKIAGKKVINEIKAEVLSKVSIHS